MRSTPDCSTCSIYVKQKLTCKDCLAKVGLHIHDPYTERYKTCSSS